MLLVTLAMAGCGGSGSSTSVEPQTQGQRPLTAAQVVVQPSGDPEFSVDQASVRFSVDNSNLLKVRLTVTSHAAVRSSVTATATCKDASGNAVATALGGAVNVEPGGVQEIELNGAIPTGTIAAMDLSIRAQASPA